MKTSVFLPIAQKIIETGLFSIQEKGQHDQYLLGGVRIGRTDELNTKLWRKYGTLSNIIINKTEEETNKILKEFGITEFAAKTTKSGSMCRLNEVK